MLYFSDCVDVGTINLFAANEAKPLKSRRISPCMYATLGNNQAALTRK